MLSRSSLSVGGALLAVCLMTLHQSAKARDDRPYDATGFASWYGNELRGQPTASGERFDPNGFTAAHRTLPLSSYAEITSLDTGRTILVRINDRGPFHGNRLIDLSSAAARQLGMAGNGARMVRVRRVNASDAEKRIVSQRRPVAGRTPLNADGLDRLRRQNGWTVPASAHAVMPVGQGPFFIRIATFSSRLRATSMATRVGADIFRASGLYQVRMGPYFSAAKLQAALAPLAAKGYSDVRIVR
jgi:rare lipoprotein A